MKTRQEIDVRIKYYEDIMLKLFQEGKSDTDEWKYTNEKIILLQWVKGVNIYRDDFF